MPEEPRQAKYVVVEISQGLNHLEPHAKIDIRELRIPAIAIGKKALTYGHLKFDAQRLRGIFITISSSHVDELADVISAEFAAVCDHLLKSYIGLRLPQLQIHPATDASQGQWAHQTTSFEWPSGFESRVNEVIRRAASG